jgi:hypothetical protein
MTKEESAAADLEQASKQWLAWLAAETTGRPDRSGSARSGAGWPEPTGSARSRAEWPEPSESAQSTTGQTGPSSPALHATEGPQSSRSALSALWDALEAWFASDDFAGSALAAAVVAPPDGRGPAAHAVLVRHRQATRRLLEDVARSAGARDPAALAGQLLTLVEGAMAGALVDRHPGVARHARELARIALAAATAPG